MYPNSFGRGLVRVLNKIGYSLPNCGCHEESVDVLKKIPHYVVYHIKGICY